MRWNLSYQELHRQLEDARAPGEWINGYDDERPDAQPDTVALLRHFWRLDRGRGSGNGFSPVPSRLAVSEVESLYRFTRLRRFWTPEEFLVAMQTCDEELLSFYAERAEQEEAKRNADT